MLTKLSAERVWKKVEELAAASENLRADALKLIEGFNELLAFRGQALSRGIMMANNC